MNLITMLPPQLAQQEAEALARQEAEALARQEAEALARQEAKAPGWQEAKAPGWKEAKAPRWTPAVSSKNDTTAKSVQPELKAWADQYTQTGAATEKQPPRQIRPEAAKHSNANLGRASSWFSDLVERRYEKQARRKAGKLKATDWLRSHVTTGETQVGIGPLTRRRIVIAASAAALIISLVIVLIAIKIPSASTMAVRVNTGTDKNAYVYQSPSVVAPKVGELKNGAKVTIQCATQGDNVSVTNQGIGVANNLWYRIDKGYISDVNVYPVTDNKTLPNC
jgi:hypothetical protein